MKINPLYLLTLLACGCLSDAATFPSRPVEFIELDRHPTPEVERSSPAPSGDAQKQPVLVTVYVGANCPPCHRLQEWWDGLSVGEKQKMGYVLRFEQVNVPDWVGVFPTSHWTGKDGNPLKMEGFEDGCKYSTAIRSTIL